MNGVGNPTDFMPFFYAFVLLLLTIDRALQLGISGVDSDNEDNDNSREAFVVSYSGIFDPQHVIAAVLHHLQVTNLLLFIDADLGFWMKPRSTTWFSQFLLGEYNDWWIHLFHMTKSATFASLGNAFRIPCAFLNATLFSQWSDMFLPVLLW